MIARFTPRVTPKSSALRIKYFIGVRDILQPRTR
jgi:hypothetical protein